MFFDTHAHLDFPDFEADLPQVLQRAEAAGITRIVTIGTTAEASRRAVALAESHPNILAAVGWHPSYVEEWTEAGWTDLQDAARHPKVAALGEMGLDFSRLPSSGVGTAAQDVEYKERQAEIFTKQLKLAEELGLNVVIHQREAFEETMELFQPYAKKVRGVFHCFVGSPEQSARVTAVGSLVSFTGIATFKNAATVRETIKAAAIDQFMLETDAPFLAPVPFRGKRCEPAHVFETAKFIAQLKECSVGELSQATCSTAQKFFRGL